MLGALRSLRGGIGFWRRVDGRNTSAYTSATAASAANTLLAAGTGGAGLPAQWPSGPAPRPCAGGQRAGTVGAAKPAIHKQGHLGPTVTDAMNNIKRNSTSPMRISFFPLQRELIYQISITQTLCSRNCFAFSSVVYYSKTRVFQRLHANFTKISNCRIKIKSGLLGPFYKTNKAPFAFEEGDFLWLKF